MQRILNLHSSELCSVPKGGCPRICLFGQCTVGAGAFSTWDTVHFYLLVVLVLGGALASAAGL